MKIDLLYFEGCPGWEETLQNLKAALRAGKMKAEIRLVKVEDDTTAARLRFLGSPSLRVAGVDMWPEERVHYNLSCRVYPTPQGLKSAPTVELLHEKLHVAGQ